MFALNSDVLSLNNEVIIKYSMFLEHLNIENIYKKKELLNGYLAFLPSHHLQNTEKKIIISFPNCKTSLVSTY